MSDVTADEYAANVAARKERERLVPHVTDACDDDGCYCPEDVFWKRLLGDDDPGAPGKNWVAAAFGSATEREAGR